MKLTVLFFVILTAFFTECKVPTPEEDETPVPDIEKQAAIQKRNYTKEELEFIAKVHKELPDLHPDTFKIVETSYRRKRTPEEIAHEKKVEEERKAYEERLEEKKLREIMDKSREKIEKMDPKESEAYAKRLQEELQQVEKKAKRGEL